VPDPLLTQLLDRQEIAAVMAACIRWADLNRPEEQAPPAGTTASYRRWAGPPAR
jgi:hypothetical protein